MAKQLRILHVASGDLWAGAESMLDALARAQHDVAEVAVGAVLLNEGILAARLRQAGIAVTVLDEQVLSAPRILAKLVRAARRFGADVVHTHRQKENVLGSVAARLAGARSVRTVHGASEFHHPGWALHKQAPRMLDWVCGRFLQDRVVAVSDRLAGELSRQYPPERVATIANGVDVNGIREAARASTDLAVPPGRFNVAIVGRLVAVKRHDIFIETARRLHRHEPDRWAFHILGDGPLRTALEATTRCAEAPVHFAGFRQDLPAALARMDALMVCSDHEGLPMNVLEAMVLGVPVVAHAVGELPEVLDQGRCGLLLDSQDPAGFARALRGLRADEPRRRALIERARSRIADAYSADAMARKYLALYQGLG